jgi:dTDP-4-dehydrorhamnose reductase
MWMTPTYTRDAAKVMQEIIEKPLPFGIYHASNQGACTWFQFAQEIMRFAGLNPTLKPTETSQQQTKARRPTFSALRSAKLPAYGIRARDWKEALSDYLVEKGHLSKAGLTNKAA